MRQWIAAHSPAGMKWLNCPRPEIYRKQDVKDCGDRPENFTPLTRARNARVIEHP